MQKQPQSAVGRGPDRCADTALAEILCAQLCSSRDLSFRYGSAQWALWRDCRACRVTQEDGMLIAHALPKKIAQHANQSAETISAREFRERYFTAVAS